MTDAPPRRRRLEQEEGAHRLPLGCMAWGGVLGVIAGIMVAIYALPPILRSIYGEEHIGFGAVYESEGKRIEVVTAERDGGVFVVALRFRSNQTWAMDEEDWQLEISTQDDGLDALPPDPAVPETAFGFALGKERELILRFPAPDRVDAEPLKLHLAEPRLGFRLRPE